jgi:hypothetical protein
MPTIDLTCADWSAIWDALDYASEDVGYDLYDTRNSDFYDAEDRKYREDRRENWNRLAALIAPLMREAAHAND